MTKPVRVTCASKDVDAGTIAAVGGVDVDGRRWKLDASEAASGINDGRWTLYVEYRDERLALETGAGLDEPLLRVPGPDGENLLLQLPECPVMGWPKLR